MSDTPFDELDARLDAFEMPGKKLGSVKVDLSVRPQRTGFKAFDRHMLIRADRPDLCVIGARPGNGKTSFLVQVLRNLTKSENKTALMFSLEMDASQLKQRSLASEAGVAIDRLPFVDPARLDAAESRLEAEMLFVDDQSGLDVNTLRARAMAYNRKYGLTAVGVDYIQIVRAEGGDRRTAIGNVAEGLKQLAKDLNAPVIALAQMSREIEKRQSLSKNARPVMSDLQDCGLLENWADQILFLDGAGKRDPSRAGQVDAYVAKNRHGPTGDFILAFDASLTRFTDFEEDTL